MNSYKFSALEKIRTSKFVGIPKESITAATNYVNNLPEDAEEIHVILFMKTVGQPSTICVKVDGHNREF